MLRLCETQTFRRKIVIGAPPSYFWSFSIPNFSETQKSCSTKCYGTVRPKSRDGKIVTLALPFIPNSFRYQTVLGRQKSPSTKHFFSCETGKFGRKIVTSAFFLSSIVFDTRMFLEARRVTLWKNSTLWEKTIFTENRDTGYLFYQ